VAGPVTGEVDAGAGVVAQHPEVVGRHERGSQHSPLGQLGQPDRIDLVRLRAVGDVLDVTGVDQLHLQSARLQQIVEDAPVVRSGLQSDHLHLLLPQRRAQLQNLAGGRVHRRDRADAPAVGPGCAHAHLPELLGHVDGADPLEDLLMLLVEDLLGLPLNLGHRPASFRQHNVRKGGTPGDPGREAKF
jgi:hypothetical protein